MPARWRIIGANSWVGDPAAVDGRCRSGHRGGGQSGEEDDRAHRVRVLAEPAQLDLGAQAGADLGNFAHIVSGGFHRARPIPSSGTSAMGLHTLCAARRPPGALSQTDVRLIVSWLFQIPAVSKYDASKVPKALSCKAFAHIV